MNRFATCFLLCLTVSLCLGAAPSARAQEDARELNRKGLLSIQSGNYGEAKEFLLRAMKLEPTWAEPYFNAAHLLKVVKKPEDMRKALKKAYELEPKNSTYVDAYCKLLLDDLNAAETRKDRDAMRSIREEIVKINPSELSIGWTLIKDAFEAKDFTRARTLGLDLLDKNKKELPEYRRAELGEIFLVLAKIEFAENKILKAKEYADKAGRYPIDHPERAKEMIADVKKAQKETAEGHLKLGKSFVGKGQFEAALDEFNRGLTVDPDNEPIKEQITALNNNQSAKELYASALKHVSGEKWIEARDLLERVVSLQPSNVEAKKHLAKAKAYEEDLKKKLGRADPIPRFTEERAALTENYISAGKRFSTANNLKDAKVEFDRALALIAVDSKLEKYRGDVEAEMGKIGAIDSAKDLWERGREHYKNAEYEESIKCLEQLPIDYQVDLLSFLSYSYWKTGNEDKAKEFANRQLAKQADNNRAKFVLGNIYHTQNNNAAAYKILKEIKDVDPDYPGIDDILYKTGSYTWGPVVIPLLVVLLLFWIAYGIYNKLPEHNKNAAINRARKYLQQTMYKECIDELNAVKRLPILTPYDGAVISRILGQAFLKTGAYDRAIGECKHLLGINPQDSEAQMWLGFAYLGRRILSPETLPILLTLYKTENKNVALVSLLGQHYVSQKTLSPEGVEVLERWLELDSNNPEVLKPLGKYYLQKGKSDDKAMTVFNRMMATMTKPEPEFLMGVAKLHLRMKEYEQSLKLCEQVLSIDINNELVHAVLRETYAKMEKLTELIEIYRAFLAENPYNVAFQKGLTEASKLLSKAPPPKMGSSAPPSEKDGTEGGGAEDGILCPHCQQPNSKADYYCQHCGKSIVG